MKLLVSTSLALALAAALAACGNKAAPAAEAEAPAPFVQGNQVRFTPGHPQLALLTVTAAKPGQSVRVELPARLMWNEERTQRIYPPFAGRVNAIHADLGSAVKPGTVLAQLASPDFGIAQADTAKAQADMALSRKNLQRQRELFEAGIVARKDLEQSEAEAARAQAEAARAGARTALYGGGRGGVDQRLALTSGITGVVVERNLNPGQELRPDQAGPGVPALFVLSDPTSLWVQIDARETEVGTLRPGASFELTVPGLPKETFEGRVTAAADFVDPSSRTIKVRGVVPNPDRKLKAEMLATAHFERSLGAGVLIPASALILRGAQHTVLVEAQPGVFEPREVQIGWSGAKDVIVSRGLEAGEMVVSENTLLLARLLRLAQEAATASATPAQEATKSVATTGGTKP
jgi:cobalt-zinc-cadmium efflux system membrane fusion protein